MTEINMANPSRRRRTDIRMKKHSLKTDMTPMVDLGFLLITFFVITVQLSKPAIVDLNMPKSGPAMDLANSNALTVLLDDADHVYYYHGTWKDALASGKIFKTNFSVGNGVGKVIREKQRWLDGYNQKEGRSGLMLLIKAGKDASYEHVINGLDEAMINLVKKYAVLSAEPDELEWMKKQKP
jgi:biopolymer transport protein ExbD